MMSVTLESHHRSCHHTLATAIPAANPVLPPPDRVPLRSMVWEARAKAHNKTPTAATAPPRAPSVLQEMEHDPDAGAPGRPAPVEPPAGWGPGGFPCRTMASGPSDARESGAGSGLGVIIVTLAYEGLG
ncbi:hypothetical protein E2562_019955 [Oryza meyeriana var. granulata]|uniref:Uncharacterized protein n=1 Tax=Oryza meyeriana var. granulata TaxID=110450 RepID=A0A6G1CIL2_9ORYZ|nr:hypothetical protein E2562_019955 [Oryza meyeriana var. granulata]